MTNDFRIPVLTFWEPITGLVVVVEQQPNSIKGQDLDGTRWEVTAQMDLVTVGGQPVTVHEMDGEEIVSAWVHTDRDRVLIQRR